MEAITCTDAVVGMPVFRPLIGMDKLEITEIAEKIGTYETSILPYEDCCTVFTPRHPPSPSPGSTPCRTRSANWISRRWSQKPWRTRA